MRGNGNMILGSCTCTHSLQLTARTEPNYVHVHVYVHVCANYNVHVNCTCGGNSLSRLCVNNFLFMGVCMYLASIFENDEIMAQCKFF